MGFSKRDELIQQEEEDGLIEYITISNDGQHESMKLLIDLKNIFSYVKQHKLKNSWALLENPSVLKVKYSNHLTRTADVPDELKTIVASGEDNTVELQLFTAAQDNLRGIKLWDYFK